MFVILWKKWKKLASSSINQSHEKPKTVHTSENIDAVAESEREATWTSIHRRSQQLNTSEISLTRILHKGPGVTSYKFQLFQELKPIDHSMRFRFAKWACDQLTENADFDEKIIFSDETYFDLGGYVNKQNCRTWGTKTHPKRVTVWWGFWARGIIGPLLSQ